jgi:hypothetical protein
VQHRHQSAAAVSENHSATVSGCRNNAADHAGISGAIERSQGRKSSFLKKRSKKLSLPGGSNPIRIGPRTPPSKSFLVLLCKKEHSFVSVYAIITFLVLTPIFAVRVPCLGDYLNHLARLHILTSIGHSPALRQFFEPRWQIVPYFGMDVPVAALTHIMDIYQAGRIFVAVCVLMPVLAAVSLHYALYRRIGLAPALAFLLCYNFVLALGFLNYLFSAALAVMLFAAWIAAAHWPLWRRAAVFPALALIIYFSHVFAFVAYGLLLIGYELGRGWTRGRSAWRITAADVAAAGAQAILPVILTLVLHTASTYGTEHVTRYGSFADRVGAVISPVYFPGGDPALVGAFVLAPLLGLLLARGMRLPRAIWPALALVAAAALAVPGMLLNVWGAEFRLPLVAAMVLAGAARPRPGFGRRSAVLVLTALVALIGARVWTATALLTALDTQVAHMRQLVTQLPRGARLLVVDGPPDAPGRLAKLAIIGHMSLVAAIDRDAFVPLLFTGTTPLRLLPTMQNSASQGVPAISVAMLRDGFARPAPSGLLPAYKDGAQMYWLGWPQKFDDVLITHYGGAIGPLPPVLRRVAGNEVATLYSIQTK